MRDFIHINDVIDAYGRAIERIDVVRGNVFNIGSGAQHTLSDAVACVMKCTGATTRPTYTGGVPPQQEPTTWVADISKARRLLGWEPQYGLEEGVAADIEWFKKNRTLYE